jgi:hypothetical protein
MRIVGTMAPVYWRTGPVFWLALDQVGAEVVVLRLVPSQRLAVLRKVCDFVCREAERALVVVGRAHGVRRGRGAIVKAGRVLPDAFKRRPSVCLPATNRCCRRPTCGTS